MKQYLTLFLPLMSVFMLGSDQSPVFEKVSIFSNLQTHIIYIIVFAVISIAAIIFALLYYKKRK